MTALSPDPPSARPPKISRFSLYRPHFRSFSPSGDLLVSFFSLFGGLLVEFWWCFGLPGPSNVRVFELGLSCEPPAACRPLVAFTRQPVSGILHPETIIICSSTQGMFVTKRPETVSTKKRETTREEKRREATCEEKRSNTCTLEGQRSPGRVPNISQWMLLKCALWHSWQVLLCTEHWTSDLRCLGVCVCLCRSVGVFVWVLVGMGVSVCVCVCGS